MKLTLSAVKTLSALSFCFILFFMFSHELFAKVGVGMGAGEVRVTEDIKPGGIYTLPNLRVFNTGDETTTYGMNIAYHQDNPQLRPDKSWFTFNPKTFTVEPGESQEVQVTMFVPVKTNPGDYFAFVESGPLATGDAGTSVGVAVATKLYFTVVHANMWQAITYRISAFFDTYAPWPAIALGIVIVGLLGLAFVRFFSLDISVRKKGVQE